MIGAAIPSNWSRSCSSGCLSLTFKLLSKMKGYIRSSNVVRTAFAFRRLRWQKNRSATLGNALQSLALIRGNLSNAFVFLACPNQEAKKSFKFL